MLLFQSHFSKESWETRASGQAVFSQECVGALLIDAKSAELNIELLQFYPEKTANLKCIRPLVNAEDFYL